MPDLDGYLADHRQDFEQQLGELLRIPSVSMDARHEPDVRRAAQWLVQYLTGLNLKVQLLEEGGHPIVYACTDPVPGKPVVLVYGHYDVQPADPLDEWVSPPFEPTVRDGNVYARGATDDKGQMLTHLLSARAWLETAGKLPVQLKLLIEGEEEIGSASLERLLSRPEAAEQLACDIVVISDTSQFGQGQPAITYGLRGIAYFELRLQGPRQDLHSGTFGGAVTNPANALCRILTLLIDEQGRIQVPGFYDDVVALSDRERAAFAALPFSDQHFMERTGVDGLTGEAGYSTLERRWARPTFDIHGLTSGYQGPGSKTVLPARASAKFSFRLVPNQDPRAIAQSVRTMLQSLCPLGIQMELVEMHHAPAFVIPLDSPYVDAAARAIEKGFGRRPVFIREGGSIPIVTQFSRRLHADSLLLGWGLDSDNPHGPNEKFSLADFHRGIRASAQLWDELSRIGID